MNKRGFTLIELLTVIVLLAIIAIIAFPAVQSSIINSREKIYNDNVKIIKDAAMRMVADGYEYDDNIIKVKDLYNSGYLENKKLMDPRTNNTMMCDKLIITFENNQYKYSYEPATDAEVSGCIVE